MRDRQPNTETQRRWPAALTRRKVVGAAGIVGVALLGASTLTTPVQLTTAQGTRTAQAPLTSVTIDTVTHRDQLDAKGVIRSTLTTHTGNELVLAMLGSDGPRSAQAFTSVTAEGLVFHPVVRANRQPGDAEIYAAMAPQSVSNVVVMATRSNGAYTGMLTLIALKGATGLGAVGSASFASGAPTVSLQTNASNSLILAVGDDWNNATSRTVASGNTLLSQYLDQATGDTYWTQDAVGGAAGSSTKISDSAPTNDISNVAAVEVVGTALTSPTPTATSTSTPKISPPPTATATVTATPCYGCTPIASPTPTTTGGYTPPGPSGIANCSGLENQSSCEWPGASNTGFANTAITKISSVSQLKVLTSANVPEPAGCNKNTLSHQELKIFCDNTVLDGYDVVNIDVFVSAANVTFSRDNFDDHLLTNCGCQDIIDVDFSKPSAHLLVEDSTGNCYGWQGDCERIIGFSQYSLLRDNFYGATDAIIYDNGSTDVEDSWFHGAYGCLAYQHPTGPEDWCGIHNDVIQKSEGSNDKLIHNYIDGDVSSGDSGMMCCTHQGAVNNLQIVGNLFNAPGYQLYSGAPGQNRLTNVLVENNHFERAPEGHYHCCGGGNSQFYGPYTGTNGNNSITFSNNFWDDNGHKISG